jgi:hypothetical protein
VTRIAFALSVFALFAAAFAYSVTHWAFPPVGFEGMLVFGGMSFWLAAIAAGIAALICVEAFLHKRLRLKWSFVCAVLAGIVLFVTVRFP